jgi:hypothetical protein
VGEICGSAITVAAVNQLDAKTAKKISAKTIDRSQSHEEAERLLKRIG